MEGVEEAERQRSGNWCELQNEMIAERNDKVMEECVTK